MQERQRIPATMGKRPLIATIASVSHYSEDEQQLLTPKYLGDLLPLYFGAIIALSAPYPLNGRCSTLSDAADASSLLSSWRRCHRLQSRRCTSSIGFCEKKFTRFVYTNPCIFTNAYWLTGIPQNVTYRSATTPGRLRYTIINELRHSTFLWHANLRWGKKVKKRLNAAS